ncbi:MAG: type IV pili twitching motility protein PilT, partial [Deltaproteobacteria bacterium]|nr:type IV pili twitching motility protein PilT [Deltaproteobacteria bacterium]
VFGTLHTSTAASTVDRVIDQFPADRQDQIRMMLSVSLKGVIAQTAMQTGAKLGMCSLNDDLIRLVKERVIDPVEAYQKCVEKSDLESRLRVAGFSLP